MKNTLNELKSALEQNKLSQMEQETLKTIIVDFLSRKKENPSPKSDQNENDDWDFEIDDIIGRRA